MFLKKLKLTNYRNYVNFEEEFDHLKTIIVGQNAQGKSNILEAINILATSESNRAERDNELICFGKEYAVISANIQTGVGAGRDLPLLEIALQINETGRRKLKINSITKKAPQADLIGNFFAVMFSCDDLYLVKGSPQARRRWLDSTLFQLNLKYHTTLQDYQKSIAQKNALLKQAQETQMSKRDLKEQLEIWNEQIVNHGTEIIIMRIDFVEEIEPIAREFLNNISEHTEKIELIYSSTIKRTELRGKGKARLASSNSPSSSKELKDLFKEALNNAFEEELARSQSVIGPHRDDIIFFINKKEAKSFASQGQQRSLVLAIKLAELKIIENRKEEVPVLLLDDVFAELDETRQDFLLHNLPTNIQTFLTTTHISDIQKEFLKEASILEVKEGKVVN